jgi:hypothetical protein
MARDLKRKVLDSSSLISAVRNVVWLLGGASAGVVYAYAKGTSWGVMLTVALSLSAVIIVAVLLIRRKFRRMRDELAVRVEELEGELAKQRGVYESLQKEIGILERTAQGFIDTPLGYRVKSAKYSYSFDRLDYSAHLQEVDTEVEATRNGVSLFEGRYSWSGSGSADLTLETSRQILLSDPMMRLRGYNYYYVYLRRPLLIGDAEQIRVRQSFIDHDRRMDPQLTKTVREPLDSLILSVSFPEGGPGRADVWALSRRSERDDSEVVARYPLEWEEGARRATLRIDQPEQRMTYAIEWDWDAYKAVETSRRANGNTPEATVHKARRSVEDSQDARGDG